MFIQYELITKYIAHHGSSAYPAIRKHTDTTATDTSTAPFIHSLRALGIFFISLLYHQKTLFYYYQQNYLANGLHLRLI